MQNVIGSIRVLTGLSNSSRTAFRHPVRISPHAFRCDLCGGQASITGPGDRVSMKHRCPDNDMFEEFPGALRYVGVREHARRVWATFRRELPRRVSGQRSERGGHIDLGESRSVSIQLDAREISQATLNTIYGGNAPQIGKPDRPQDDPYVAVDILEKNLEKPQFSPWSGYEAMGQELDTEQIDRAYASGFEFPPRYKMASEGTDKREAN